MLIASQWKLTPRNEYSIISRTGATVIGTLAQSPTELSQNVVVNLGEVTFYMYKSPFFSADFKKKIQVFGNMINDCFTQLAVRVDGVKAVVFFQGHFITKVVCNGETIQPTEQNNSFERKLLGGIKLDLNRQSFYLGREKDIGVNITPHATLEFFSPKNGLTRGEFICLQKLYRQTYLMDEDSKEFDKFRTKMELRNGDIFRAKKNFEKGTCLHFENNKAQVRSGRIYLAEFEEKLHEEYKLDQDGEHVSTDDEVGQICQKPLF